MQTLIIYDQSGKIWNITYGEDTLPLGLTAISVDTPAGSQISSIDVSNPESPQVVFTYLPETDIDILQKTMNQVLIEVSNISNTVKPVSLAASFMAEGFTDEQALQVVALYPEWSADSVEYKTGERIRYGGILYKVLQDHTSQEIWNPEDAPSLFAKVLVETPGEIVEWEQPESTNGYSKGDKVTHNGKTYESLVDNNVWEPGVIGTEGQWKEITEDSEEEVTE